MLVTDFSRSFLTFRVDLLAQPAITLSHRPSTTENNARIQIECVCRLTSQKTGECKTYVLGASCKTERDEGAGIAPDDLPKLFLPFSRLENTKKMASGTGLGLSSVKKIIEGHGGNVSIQSIQGAGTTVEIILTLLKPQGETG